MDMLFADICNVRKEQLAWRVTEERGGGQFGRSFPLMRIRMC